MPRTASSRRPAIPPATPGDNTCLTPRARCGRYGFSRPRKRNADAKLFLRTFGCQMNEYDSEKIADVLREAEGLEPAARPEDADVIVFNTCSVREKGPGKAVRRPRPGLRPEHTSRCAADAVGPFVAQGRRSSRDHVARLAFRCLTGRGRRTAFPGLSRTEQVLNTITSASSGRAAGSRTLGSAQPRRRSLRVVLVSSGSRKCAGRAFAISVALPRA